MESGSVPREHPSPEPLTATAHPEARSLNRFLGKLVGDTWRELARNLGGHRAYPEYSGICPLGDPKLLPFLDQPGVFLIFGPAPELRILFLGSSQAPLSAAVFSRISRDPASGFRWRWEGSTTHSPTFIACIAMEEEWTLIRPFKTLLARRLEGKRDQVGALGADGPFL